MLQCCPNNIVGGAYAVLMRCWSALRACQQNVSARLVEGAMGGGRKAGAGFLQAGVSWELGGSFSAADDPRADSEAMGGQRQGGTILGRQGVA